MSRERKREHEKYLDRQQFAALVAAAKKHPYPRAHQLFFAAGALGLRITEAITLNRGCFGQLDHGFVEIETLKRKDRSRPKIVDGKQVGFEHPVLPVAIGPVAQEFFGRLLKETPAGQHYLFPGRTPKGHISSIHAQRIFHACALKAGLGPRYSFHSLRHHKGVMTWEQSKDYDQVKKEMRHASAQTTEIYVHLSPKDRLERAARIDAEYKGIV